MWLTAAAFVVGCNPATAPEFPTTSYAPQNAVTQFREKIPIEETITFFSECAGEIVELQIRQLLIIHEVTREGVMFHGHFTILDRGTSGVGLTSGTRYRQVGVTKGNLNIHEPVPVTESFVNQLNLISAGSRPNLTIHESFHITINANGEIAVVRETERVECK
ncbi:MAG: hypothetical protein H0W29_09070 [Gemmatimonadales bacterium]|nr:hypothetical protein [Gemmatimonadales bacterium]